MAEQSFMARFGARLVTNGYRDPADHARHQEARPLARGDWHRLSRVDPPCRRGRPPSIEVDDLVAAGRTAGSGSSAVRLPRSTSTSPGCRAGAGDRAAGSRAAGRHAGAAHRQGARSGCWSIARRSPSPASGARRWRCCASASSSSPMPCIPTPAAPYAWPEEGLADLDIASLPVIDGRAGGAFLDEALALVPERLRQNSLSARDRPRHGRGPSHAQAGTLAAIRAALAWLPNAELDYDSWMRIGMALKGALGRGGWRALRRLVGAGGQERPGDHARRRGRASSPSGSAPARSTTSPWSGAGSRRSGLRARRQPQACDGASGGGPAGDGLRSRSPKSGAHPPRHAAVRPAHPRRAGGRSDRAT